MKRKIAFVFIVIMFLLLNGLYGKVFYFKGEKLIKCRIHFPDNYNKQESYPLVIGLHGNGGSSEGFSSLWKGFKKRDFIFACPEGPYIVKYKNNSQRHGYGWLLSVKDRKIWEVGDRLLEKYILNIIKEIKEHYSVSKVFLFGFSAGASSAYVIGIKNPEIISGIIPVSGMLQLYRNYSVFTEEHIKKGNKLPVLIIHGKKDRAIKFDVGKNIYKKLKGYDYKVRFYPYKGGHRITREVLDTLYKWIKLNS